MKFLEIKDPPFTVFINIDHISTVRVGHNTNNMVIQTIDGQSFTFQGGLSTILWLELKELSILIMKDEGNTVSGNA